MPNFLAKAPCLRFNLSRTALTRTPTSLTILLRSFCLLILIFHFLKKNLDNCDVFYYNCDMFGFDKVIIEETCAVKSRLMYPGVFIGAAGGAPGQEAYQTIFHESIIHVLPVNSNHFFSFKQTGIAHRLHKLHRLPGLTPVIKIRNICIIILPNLVFISKFFLRHLRIPEAIIGWGCHPLCVNPGNLWINKIKQEDYHDKNFQVDH